MNPSVVKTEIYSGKNLESALSENEKAVLKTLAYFDIFHYPLQANEIKNFIPVPLSEAQIHDTLGDLQLKKLIFSHYEYYSLHDNPLLVPRRVKGNQKADKLLIKADRIGRFLYHFPFVRGIAVSGSLSKKFAGENSDIDFFIITKADRLWIARTFMHLFKKLTFLTGHQHLFCMNYYIDEKSLRIKEENIFTAIEIKTLLPIAGEKTINNFFEENKWIYKWLPEISFCEPPKRGVSREWPKKIIEWILKGKIGNGLDNLFYEITQRRWRRKAKHEKRNCKGARMSLDTGKHFAKSNPEDFQEKVLSRYKEKLQALAIGIF
ncbi:MAG TPA: nucleotidyltransferase domain-containing protein [Chitinophagaceae bacterium]|nr:nucleotidyltransferase domain-containing protein [Chitinophagaceae bacterium]